MRRDQDTGDWLVLAGFGLSGVGLSVAVRHLAGPGPFLADFHFRGYATDPTWPNAVYADAILAITLSGLLAGGLILLLHRVLARNDHHLGRWLQLGAILLVSLALLGLAAFRCFAP
ncbi:MAG: hypothetical protein JWM33_4013 [Caulobacteraceae bacterium]|nr:hypothetical protein [Caulobacteraceae bacterium]